MSCFPCFGSKNTEDEQSEVPVAQVIDTTPTTAPAVNNPSNQSADGVSNGPNAVENNGSRTFTFRELLMATKNFKQECLIGEGGFGKLYKGKLQSGEVVAVKHLDRNGTQGNKEFLVEVLILTLLHHPNLVKLIGYCADGEQRLIVYEYLSFGSLDTHLHSITDEKKPLDWQTRMKIASGIAQGLEYLHEKANPPIFYRDLKPVNILLDEDRNARLSGYGLAKLVNGDTKTHASPRVMGTYGYCAPEYERQGELTVKSDVYSFGVILLELITGRRALDTTRPKEEQTLVSWAQPLFRDQKKYPDMADPLLEGRFPQKSLNQAIGMVAMCLQEEPSVRPLMSDVVSMLSFLEVTPPEEAKPASLEAAPPESKVDEHDSEDEKDSSSSGDESDENSVGSQSDDEDHPKDQNENIPNGSQNFEKQGSSSQHEVEANPGNKSHNSLSSDDESDSSSASSENDDGDHPKDQMEYIPNQSQIFEKQGSGSQHEMEANPENKSRNSNERECSSSISRSENDSHDCSSHHISKKYDGNEGSIDNSSMGRNSKAGWTDKTSEHNSMKNTSPGAPQGHVSMNLRQNSIEESQGGSINGSSIGHGRYEEESFVWSSGSSSDYQLNDGSARRNSGHMNNVGLSMRQQSIPNS